MDSQLHILMTDNTSNAHYRKLVNIQCHVHTWYTKERNMYCNKHLTFLYFFMLAKAQGEPGYM